MNEINLILDMDSTLIANFGQQIKPRDHLQTFLFFCFSNFKTVSIWTAAEYIWFDAVNQSLFQPIMKNISKLIQKPCNFTFVYVRPQGKIKYVIRPQTQIQAIKISTTFGIKSGNFQVLINSIQLLLMTHQIHIVIIIKMPFT
jgi:hypothetical protein